MQEKEEEEEEAFLAVEIRFVVCRNAKANKRGVRVCVCGLTATMLELAFIFHCAYIVQIDIYTGRNQETFSLSTFHKTKTFFLQCTQLEISKPCSNLL